MNVLSRCTLGLLILNAGIAHAAITTTGNVTPLDVSDLSYTQTIHIGKNNDGSLTIDDSSVLSTGDSILGYTSNAEGTVTVSDINSTWNSGILCVGDNGTGEVSILAGGKVSSDISTLGSGMNSSGTVNVSGNNSTWENGIDLTIGSFGNGYLNVNNAGTVITASCQIGTNSTASGTINVSGENSTWTNSGELCVGNDGKGELNIAENGLVCVTGTLKIDVDQNNDSFINITSGGMLALSGDIDDSLTTFFNSVEGANSIRYLNYVNDTWTPLTDAVENTDYTLEYQPEGNLEGYTLLTVLEDQGTSHGAPPLPGDANGDGVVDGSDVTILANNWQTLTGATQSMGDFNGDGVVDGSDVTILANNWQTGVKTTTIASVPEPSPLLLLLFGLPALGFLRHIR